MVVAVPCLVHVQFATRPAESEGGGCRAAGGAVVRAVEPKGAVEEVGQLVACAMARCDGVWDGGIGEVEVDVAPRVLMCRGGEEVRGVEVKVLDGPLKVVEGFVGTAWRRGPW